MKGCPYDNAVAEAVKTEFANGAHFFFLESPSISFIDRWAFLIFNFRKTKNEKRKTSIAISLN